MAEPMVTEDGGEDRVVKEFDVFLSKPIDDTTQLYLLQCPLRPPWRPYNIDSSLNSEQREDTNIQLKPMQGRVEIEIPLDTRSENYNNLAAEHLQIKTQHLKSQPAPLRTSHAVGILTKDGQLHLVPVDNAVQLRPSLQHLDHADAELREQAARKEAEDRGEPYDEDGAGRDAPPVPQLMPIKVSVQRPETERQVEARLRRQREEEPWRPLQGFSSNSGLAHHVMKAITTPAEGEPKYELGKKDYLRALTTDLAHAPSLDFNPGVPKRLQKPRVPPPAAPPAS